MTLPFSFGLVDEYGLNRDSCDLPDYCDCSITQTMVQTVWLVFTGKLQEFVDF